jgi:hypothetical protein
VTGGRRPAAPASVEGVNRKVLIRLLIVAAAFWIARVLA